MDHDDHTMPSNPRCAMNMLWNTNIVDTCIVFRSWHIGTHTAFIVSCLLIVLLGVFYEYLRMFQRKIDVLVASSLARTGQAKRASSGRRRPSRSPVASGVGADGDCEEQGLLSGRRLWGAASTGTPVPFVYRALRATLYALNVALSFFMMLIFMTYNAYLLLSVVLGAAIGHYIFGATINTNAVLLDPYDGGKCMSCH